VTKYLIVGNSAGGIGAAEAIREVDREGSLTIVSDESYPAYSRPLISEYLATGYPLERMLFRAPDFYYKNNIVALLGRKVIRLDLDQNAVELEDGERIVWERLLIATGGVPIIPKMGGLNQSEIFTFTTLDDAKRIEESLGKVGRAVVIGGGLIGISITEALVKRHMKVTVVEMMERILGTVLDKTASRFAREALEQAGVRVITGHTVAGISSEPSQRRVKGVMLDSGEWLPCDLVVVAIGVAPRTELVSGTKIRTNRGIVVDRYMATNCPSVYSCGDAAESYDFIHGTNRVIPIWPNAYIGGRVAGYNMAGIKTEYPGGTAMNSLKYFGLPIIAAGMVNLPNGEDGQGYEVLTRLDDNIYQKVVLKDGVIMGMVFVNSIDRAGIVFGLMKDQINVHQFKESLVSEDFGLASFPQELWQKRLELSNLSCAVSKVALIPESEESIVGE
jgi:NAD(P)H-nitrite reductase large subunit